MVLHVPNFFFFLHRVVFLLTQLILLIRGNFYMVYINNELPLYIHELRGLLVQRVNNLIATQPERYKQSRALDLTHTFLSAHCRSIMLDVMVEIFYYFDESMGSEWHAVQYEHYSKDVHKTFIYFTEDISEISRMDRDVVNSIVDMFLLILGIIRYLFDIELGITEPVQLATTIENDTRFNPNNEPESLAILLTKILDRLNSFYYDTRSHYLAFTCDTGIFSKRSTPSNSVTHCGYLLAHLSINDDASSELYNISMSDISVRCNACNPCTFNLSTEEMVPVILDNSAFELGESVEPAGLIEWYSLLLDRAVIREGAGYEYVYVMPDKLGDAEATLHNSNDFFGKLLSSSYMANTANHMEITAHSPMYVLHSSSSTKPTGTSEYIKDKTENLKQIIRGYVHTRAKHQDELPVRNLWIGLPMMRYSDESSLSFDIQGGFLRAALLNHIGQYDIWSDIISDVRGTLSDKEKDILANTNVYFHILGVVSPVEYSRLTPQGKSKIRSLDTSFPFATAVKTNKITDHLENAHSITSRIPSKPWHLGIKVRGVDEKPFTMSLRSLVHAQEDQRAKSLSFASYQLELWVNVLKKMSINQRLFEEWVADIWDDSYTEPEHR